MGGGATSGSISLKIEEILLLHTFANISSSYAHAFPPECHVLLGLGIFIYDSQRNNNSTLWSVHMNSTYLLLVMLMFSAPVFVVLLQKQTTVATHDPT